MKTILDQNSSSGIEQPINGEYGGSSASASILGNFSVHEGVYKSESGSTRPGSVLMVNVLGSFNKLVALPSPDIWQRLLKPGVFAAGHIEIQIQTSGYILRRTTPWALTYCVLCSKGYLVIYTKERDCVGHAVCIASAKKLDVSNRRIEQFDSDTRSNTIKNYCSITIKWSYGTVFVQLADKQIEPWRKAFIDAFDGRDLAVPTSAVQRVDRDAALAPTQPTSFAQQQHYQPQINRSVSLTNRPYHHGPTTATAPASVIVEEDPSAPSDFADAETDNAAGVHTTTNNNTNANAGREAITETERSQIGVNNANGQSQAPQANDDANANEHEDEYNLNSNMWSDDEPSENIPQIMRRSYYASLPMSFAHRYRSDGALRLVPHGGRQSERQPLMEWLSQVGANSRFRLAKHYFETGTFPQSSPPLAMTTAATSDSADKAGPSSELADQVDRH